jgi:hypothetical protein
VAEVEAVGEGVSEPLLVPVGELLAVVEGVEVADAVVVGEGEGVGGRVPLCD